MWYKHQQDLITANPHRRGVGFGCGCGKTKVVLELAKNKGGTVLIVAPKTQVLDRVWEREAEKWGYNLPMTVMSKEAFKKSAPKADILILDESHCFLGVTPMTRYKDKIEIPRTSQLFEATLAWVQKNKPKYIYMASATPFPHPMALWASARVFGADWDYFAFRRKFYAFVPLIGRGVWLPKKDKQHEALLVGLAQKFWTFGRLEDFFDVPDQVVKDIGVGLESAQKRKIKELPLLYPEPLALVGKTHQLEQGIFEGYIINEAKTEQIVDLAKEFPKLLVFARYTAQIDHIRAEVSKKTKHKVLVLDGRTDDRRAILEATEAPGKCVVIAQSQVSTGYELPSFRCTVFASMSYSFVDYQQALGRTQRANNISKNVYVHLLAGEVDKEVLKCVRNKQDFNELLFSQIEQTHNRRKI